MEALQHEFEECRMKQACLSQELDVLSQIYGEERQAHEKDVQSLKSQLRNAEASRDKLQQDFSTSETERECLLALKVKLEKKISILIVEIADVKSCLLLLKEQQENLIAAHNKQVEEKKEAIRQCKQLEIELEKVSSVRQAYERLLEINRKLQAEIGDMKSKMDKEKKAIRHEYEKKLDKLKAKMVSINTAFMKGGEECVC